MLTARPPVPGELERAAYRGLPPAVVPFLAKRHALASPDDIRVANLQRMVSARALRSARLSVAYDETALAMFADNYAQICGRFPLEAAAEFTRSHGVAVPAGRNLKPEGIRARLKSAAWWRRTLRHTWGRRAENGMRKIGMIRAGEQPYASDAAVENHLAGRRRTIGFFEKHEMVSDEGDAIPLTELAKHSLWNPDIRRGELMQRARGFNEIAEELGHGALFATLTAPSAYHAELKAAGRNARYCGSDIREAQAVLVRFWQRARTALKNAGVFYYGIRTAEPHQDGTPHWHVLIFAPADALERFATIVRAAWLSELGDEPGAAAHRCEFKTLDPANDGAVGYLAKYVSKNIDGFGSIGAENSVETGARIDAEVVRVTTWARLHGIRQFQQLGGPPVGLWREARRLRVATPDPDIERARACADAGDWAGFINSTGGIAAGRKGPLKIERVETGQLNRYGEPRPAAVIGIRYCSAVAITRPNTWELRKKCITTSTTSAAPASGSPLSAWRSSSRVSAKVKAASDSGSLLPWTRGNNCAGPLAGGYALNLAGMPSLWSTLLENSQGPPDK